MLNIPQNQPTRRAAFLFQDEDDVFDTGGGQDRSLTTDFLLRTARGQEVFAGNDLSAGLFFEFEAGAFGDAVAFFSGFEVPINCHAVLAWQNAASAKAVERGKESSSFRL